MPNKAAASTALSGRQKRQGRANPLAPNCVNLQLSLSRNAGLGTCWLEHLADCCNDFIDSDHEGENIDGAEGVDYEL
jgi:hypothetical protein